MSLKHFKTYPEKYKSGKCRYIFTDHALQNSEPLSVEIFIKIYVCASKGLETISTVFIGQFAPPV